MPAPADLHPPRRAGAARGGRATVGFAAVLVVLALGLLVGSGYFDAGGRGDAGRIAVLETQIKCPSCDDLSVAQSSSSTSLAVRQQISTLVRRGASNQQIENTLVDEYGPTILLEPPASGLSSVVYLLPAVAGAVAVVALGTLFWRRSREMARLRHDATPGAADPEPSDGRGGADR